jgi:RNA polymerase II-associated protein 1
MAIPGERFELDLDADNFTFNHESQRSSQQRSEPSIINKIQEHETDDIPPAPTFKKTESGFPGPKARRNVSAFKRSQQIGQQRPSPAVPSTVSRGPSDAAIAHRLANKHGHDPLAAEKAQISAENAAKLAAMSEEELEEERAELLSSLSPGLLQRFLKRANIDESQVGEQATIQNVPGPASDPAVLSTMTKPVDGFQAAPVEDEAADNTSPPPSTQPTPLPPSSVHFPLPTRDPSHYKSLDPSSPNFFSDLRTTYFPELTHNPSSLEWLLPDNSSSPDTTSHPTTNTYSPTLTSIPATSIRFSFTGTIIAPTTALSIPVTAGLHHHGHAPDAAGYTVPELALLSRSTLPSQKCIAFQTIGRILYRLGKGEFGGKGNELNDALWSVVEEERVVEVLMEAAGREGGHQSVKAYATEALWLWRRGGGGERGLRAS